MIAQPQTEQTCSTTREGAAVVGERQERQGEGWRTRVASPRESSSPLHLAIFHTPPARGFCCALPEFTSPKLFVLFPASYQKKKKKGHFLLPRNKCLLLARSTLQPSWCGEFGKGMSLGSNTSCCISSRGGQSAIHREILIQWRDVLSLLCHPQSSDWFPASLQSPAFLPGVSSWKMLEQLDPKLCWCCKSLGISWTFSSPEGHEEATCLQCLSANDNPLLLERLLEHSGCS